MKKFVTALGLVTATLLTTQGAYASTDNAQKIAVVQKFVECNRQGLCRYGNDYESTQAIKKFLSKSAIAVLNYEQQHFERMLIDNPDSIDYSIDCSAVVTSCYSGLWTEPVYGDVEWEKPKFSLDGNTVIADFGYRDGRHFFEVVKENGQWKINNTASTYGDWWR